MNNFDAFKLWCWRRLFRAPWIERRSNQSILKEINSEYSLQGLMLKQKFQYFGHLMWKANSLEKTLILGKIEGRGRSGQQRMICLDGITVSMDMSLSKCQEILKTGKPGMLKSMGQKELDTTERLNNWTAKWMTICQQTAQSRKKDKFLEIDNPPRQNHEELENLIRVKFEVMRKESESVIKNLPKKEKHMTNCFPGRV